MALGTPLEKHWPRLWRGGKWRSRVWCKYPGGSRVLPEIPHIRTSAGSPESTKGALVQPLKSDLKRERCVLMPFYLVQERKTANGFFGEENVPGLSISPSSSVWSGKEGWGCARSQKKQGWGVFSIRWTTFINTNFSPTVKSSALSQGQHHYCLCSSPLGIPGGRD